MATVCVTEFLLVTTHEPPSRVLLESLQQVLHHSYRFFVPHSYQDQAGAECQRQG